MYIHKHQKKKKMQIVNSQKEQENSGLDAKYAAYGFIHTHCILILFQMLVHPNLKSTAMSCANPVSEKETRRNHLQLYQFALSVERLLKDKLEQGSNKTKVFSLSDCSLCLFQGGAASFCCCFIIDLFEVSHKVNKVNIHPVEVKQFCKDHPNGIHLGNSKNQKL